MFAQERQAEIAELVSASRRVSGADLSRRFDVTMETVRRDLAALEAAGRLRRVHGGAVSLDRPASVEAAMAGREAQKSPAKRRIAAAAVRLLQAEGAVTDFALDFLPDAFSGDAHLSVQSHHERAIVTGIASGATEIQLGIIAQRWLGLPRDSA